MALQEYVVQQQDGHWQVWLGERLVSGHPTCDQAMAIAGSLADRKGRASEGHARRTEVAKRQA